MHTQLEKLGAAVAAGANSPARRRLEQFFDADTFVEIDRLARDGDHPAEVVAGYGCVDGSPVYAYAQDREVCCGAVGRAQASKIRKIYDMAAQNGAPVVGMFDSDGAKLGEGIDAMDAIADILLACNNLSGVVPQIAVIAGPCVGSAALIAANADVTVAVKETDYYLNPGDESAPASLYAENEEEALSKVRELIALLPANNLAAPCAYDFDGASVVACEGIDTVLEAAADPDSLLVMGGDGACKTALGRVGGQSCGMITLSGDKVEGCAASRIARFVRLCDAFSLPVLTFVDAAGFAVAARARPSCPMPTRRRPRRKSRVITGRAYGPVYIAAAGKAGRRRRGSTPGREAVISPLAPETAVHILWKDRLAAMARSGHGPTGRPWRRNTPLKSGSPLEAAARRVSDRCRIRPEETRGRLIARCWKCSPANGCPGCPRSIPTCQLIR